MKLPRYPKYKDSGVMWLGQVPDHWNALPFFVVTREVYSPNGGMRENNLLSLSYGKVIVKDIESNEGLLPESFETYQIVNKDDIIFRLTDLQNDQRSLRTAIVRERGIVTSAYVAVTPRNIVPEYLNYLLRAYDLSKVFYSMGGGLRQSLKYTDLKRLPVLIPPVDEQEKIALHLSTETEQIDRLLFDEQRLIDMLEEKRQSMISHAVTKGLNSDVPMRPSGIDWLGEVPRHWSIVPLAYRYTIQLGKMLDSSRITGDHLRRYLRVFDVQWDDINTDDLPEMDFDEAARKKFALRAGDLLVNEGGSYPGRCAIWMKENFECYYQKALHRLRPLRPERDFSRFAFYLIQWATTRGVFIAGGNETTIEHLPAEKLRRYRFAFPPRDEQHSIAAFLDDHLSTLNMQMKISAQAIELLQERRSVLIRAAVTGQIDVRNYRPEEAPAVCQ